MPERSVNLRQSPARAFRFPSRHRARHPPLRRPLPGAVASILGQFNGQTGSTAGSKTPPTDKAVTNSGIANTISGNVTASVQQAAQNAPVSPQPTSSPTTGATLIPATVQSNLSSVSSQADPTIVAFQENPTPSGTPIPPPTPPAPQPVTITYTGHFKSTNGTAVPLSNGFIDQSANANAAYTGGVLSYPAGTPLSGMFTVNLGSAGTMTFPLVPGTSTFGSTGTTSPLGAVTGTSYMSADGSFFYANLIPVNAPAQREFIYGGLPVNSSFYQPTGTTQIYAFQIQPDAALQSNIPFVPTGLTNGLAIADTTVSPLYIVAPASTAIGNATTPSAAGVLQASLGITGQGTSQLSGLVVAIGTVGALQSSGDPIITGVLRGTFQTSATSPSVRIGSSIATVVDGNGHSFFGTSAISGFVLDQTQYNSTAPGSGVATTAVNPSTASVVPLSGSPASYAFNQPAIATSPSSGIGSNRTTQTLTGFFGGLMTTTAQAQPYAINGTALISTDATNNQVQATLTSNALNPAQTAGVSNVVMQFGGLTGNPAQSAFVDDNTYAAAESQVNPQTINGTTLVVNGDPNQAGQLYLLSSGAAPPPTSFLATQSICSSCQFLKWGYWGGDLNTGNSNNGNISRIDRANINFWVAGVPTAPGSINYPTVGTAYIYNGNAVGSVYNNGASYLASGAYSGSYNFGTNTGSVAITNFDSHNFTYGVNGNTPNSPNYSGTLLTATTTGNPSPLPFSGATNGSFFGPLAPETAGSFSAKSTVGPAYIASGVFAGHR